MTKLIRRRDTAKISRKPGVVPTRKSTGPRTSPEKNGTTDALEIMDRLFIAGQPDEAALRERLRAEVENCEIAQQIYDLRTAAGLTQRQLAALIGTSHSAIARLEDADYEGHSLAMLRRLAEALGARVEVRFVAAAKRSGRRRNQSNRATLAGK